MIPYSIEPRDKLPKFRTRNWVEINNESKRMHTYTL